MKYIRTQSDKFNLGRVELDFTPQWMPDSTAPNDHSDDAEDTERRIALPRVRMSVVGSGAFFEIRDLERVQRLRKITGSPRQVEALDVR